ncbi:MAG: histidinol dehydrogenase [Promethearchaeota archaeon]|nr:MAG: histidinol dehydrogenase [Candidatus Lokiarchaeota archaeon]
MIFLNSIRIINSDKITEKSISEFIPRQEFQFDNIKENVLQIINEVRQQGDGAIVKFSRLYDNIEMSETEIRVSKDEIQTAYSNIDQDLLNALKYAKKNLIKFHEAQIRDEWEIEIEKGVKAGQIYRPLESVGIYVPGGQAIYPSTVLMAATPAYVAGVKEIIMCSPPQSDGKVAPEILVAAKEFGIKKIYKVGGAQAIAAMTYGTKTIPKVQKVVGPGNKWVNVAKQLLSNEIAIDNPAGPSEILIIADETADFRFVILDFISQIEHDPDNMGIIVSTSLELIEKFRANLDSFIQKSERKEIIKAALNNSLIIKATDLADCTRVCNIIAPEHVEILINNPKALIKNIYNAGAIFLGTFTPVPLGDYSAGTNHVLPTGGNAKKYSGLNIFDFLKTIQTLECDRQGLKILKNSASKIAEFEGLLAHKKAIEERLKNKK